MLALPNSLEMVDTFASPGARQNRTLFILPVSRNDNCNGLADRLFGSVSKDTLCAPVPACDRTIEVLAYNGGVAGLDNSCQPAQSLFSFAKRSFGLLAFGDVDSGGMQERDRTRHIVRQLHAKFYRKWAIRISTATNHRPAVKSHS